MPLLDEVDLLPKQVKLIFCRHGIYNEKQRSAFMIQLSWLKPHQLRGFSSGVIGSFDNSGEYSNQITLVLGCGEALLTTSIFERQTE
jgi:hypothetical protein